MITITFTNGTEKTYYNQVQAFEELWNREYPKTKKSFTTYLSAINRTPDLPRIQRFMEVYGITAVRKAPRKENPQDYKSASPEYKRQLHDNPYIDLAQSIISQALEDYYLGHISTQSLHEFLLGEWFDTINVFDYDGQWLFNNALKRGRKKGKEVDVGIIKG